MSEGVTNNITRIERKFIKAITKFLEDNNLEIKYTDTDSIVTFTNSEMLQITLKTESLNKPGRETNNAKRILSFEEKDFEKFLSEIGVDWEKRSFASEVAYSIGLNELEGTVAIRRD